MNPVRNIIGRKPNNIFNGAPNKKGFQRDESTCKR